MADFAVSPFTGLTRADWERQADAMLLALRGHASPGHALVDLPGPASRNGRWSDRLEGYARGFLLAAFRLAGAGGADPLDLAGWYAQGLAAGVDPGSPERWPRPDEIDQAKVEAASIALGLHLTRPLIWDRLDPVTRDRALAWFAPVIGARFHPNNWVWFQAVVEAFLASAGGPWSPADVDAVLDRHETFARADGWYADGDDRAYDHYVGWALHLYPLLWTAMAPDHPRAAQVRHAARARLRRWLADAVLLVGADGSPLIQGRSLTYRFAAAAPFWVGAMFDATPLPPGLTRRVASGMLAHFAAHGAPDAEGLLRLGWHAPFPPMAQAYSGPASPYWASKGMLGLALPAEHLVWTEPEQPLPVERGDVQRVLPVPGWAVSATRADGIVRVINHGTDHARPGAALADAPMYARLGYSTATFPEQGEQARADPLDSAVVLLDADGRASHRTGFRTLPVDVTGGAQVAVAASGGRVHWVRPDAAGPPDNGHPRAGPVRAGPVLTVVSVLRGPLEVRLVAVEAGADAGEPGVLRVGGWPVAGDASPATGSGPGWARAVRSDGVVSLVRDLRGLAVAGLAASEGTSPLGRFGATPWLATAGPALPGAVYAALLLLTGDPAAAAAADQVTVELLDPSVARVRWPGGAASTLTLPAAGG